LKHCSHCQGPLIEIDYYGQRLIGCIECKGRIEHSLATRLSQILINQRVILESWDAQKRIEQLEALLRKLDAASSSR
jgi:hypothetical protein